MQLCQMTTRNDVPTDFPAIGINQQAWLDRLAVRVVERVWLEPAIKDLRIAEQSYKEDDGYQFCFCHEGNICKLYIWKEMHTIHTIIQTPTHIMYKYNYV